MFVQKKWQKKFYSFDLYFSQDFIYSQPNNKEAVCQPGLIVLWVNDLNYCSYVLDTWVGIETGGCSWPATKDELIDYAVRSGLPLEVLENLQEIEDEGDIYESIEDIWPDYPSKDDFLFNEEEY